MSEIWKHAQQFEYKHWWDNKKILSSPEYREQIKERSERIERWIRKFVKINKKCNVLEIGGGATQLIDFFFHGNKYAIDPLADFYKKEFSTILNPETIWSKSKAEEMPFQDEFFDIIIMRNVLDHVDSARKTLSEMRRVLNKNGIIYLGLNTFSGLLYLYKLIVKDEGHPFTFSPRNIESYIREAGFTITDGIHDAPENMSHFSDKMATVRTFKAIVRSIYLRLNFYHFNEFLLKKV